MRTLLLICFILIATAACAQVDISGKVVSSIGNLPVAGATVYINNSSIGTITNDKGEFSLKAAYNGRIDLIVSHVSFVKKTFTLHPGQSAGLMNITVDPKNTVLNEVVINSDRMTGWYKWRNLFKDHFIGKTPFAKQCLIKNPEVLIFKYDKIAEDLTVTSRNTLLIENRALGYLYKIDLNTFHYSFKNLLVNSDITVLFEDMVPKDSTEKKFFLANRETAFNGSKMDFIRSIYKGNFGDRGFKIIAAHLKKNDEKSRMVHMISDAQAKAYHENKNPATVTLATIAKGNKDSVYYYEAKLAEPDYVLKDTSNISMRDSTDINLKTANANLHLRDTLLIQYSENRKAVPLGFQLPVKNARFDMIEDQIYIHHKNILNVQYSLMILTPKKNVTIYPNGGYDDSEIFTDGSMANGKVSCLLPWDYKVGD